MVEATPTQEHDEFDDIGGAFINCWIRTDNEDTAIKIASKTLKKHCWKILKIEDSFAVTAERYEDEPDSLECFNEALKEGESYIINEWPNEPQEGDMIH
jgi:hypothetical protein